jgi:hypothetical protein
MTAIAFLGLGRMGALMAWHVLAAGHDLTVWNRTAERTQPLVAAGVPAAPTPAEAAREAEIVITMLADPAAEEAVVLGPGGVTEAIRPAACLVEMSTVGPKTALAVRDGLPAGTAFVDVPRPRRAPRTKTWAGWSSTSAQAPARGDRASPGAHGIAAACPAPPAQRRRPGAFAAACPAGCAVAHPVSGAAASTKFISAM